MIEQVRNDVEKRFNAGDKKLNDRCLGLQPQTGDRIIKPNRCLGLQPQTGDHIIKLNRRMGLQLQTGDRIIKPCYSLAPVCCSCNCKRNK